jgi:hypothetical protein
LTYSPLNLIRIMWSFTMVHRRYRPSSLSRMRQLIVVF